MKVTISRSDGNGDPVSFTQIIQIKPAELVLNFVLPPESPSRIRSVTEDTLLKVLVDDPGTIGPDDISEFKLVWSCIDVVREENCTDNENKPLNLNLTLNEQFIVRDRIRPLALLEFSVNATKISNPDIKKNSSIQLFYKEEKTPTVILNVDPELVGKKLNFNQMFKFSFETPHPNFDFDFNYVFVSFSHPEQ